MRLKLAIAPTVEPITVADLETHSRLGSGYIASLSETAAAGIFIAAVRQRCEAITRRQLINATWDLILDGFPGGRTPIEIPLPPLQSITSITYMDTDGATRTLSSSLYRVIGSESAPITPKCQPGKVLTIVGEVWPATQEDIETVTIRFTCGYGAAGAAVPEGIKNWILLNVANLWENRETVIIGKGTEFDFSSLADGLLEDFRIYRW